MLKKTEAYILKLRHSFKVAEKS